MPGARLWVLCVEFYRRDIYRGQVSSRQVYYTLETSPHLPEGPFQVLRRFVRLNWVELVNVLPGDSHFEELSPAAGAALLVSLGWDTAWSGSSVPYLDRSSAAPVWRG
jgi:hypothetical protein